MNSKKRELRLEIKEVENRGLPAAAVAGATAAAACSILCCYFCTSTCEINPDF